MNGPRKVQRKLRERDIQDRCVRYAKSQGYWARKFSSPSQRSVPDFLFSKDCTMRLGGIKFAVEFKRPGETSTPAQLEEQQKMRDAGWDVYECDDVDKFKQIVFEYENFSWLT